MQRTRNVLRLWLPLALVTTVLCGLIYVSLQQTLRNGANDPQIQLAQDAADALAHGAAANAVVPAAQIDVARSLAPFVMVFDANGKALASSGSLHGQPPTLPTGVLEYVRQHGEDRVTWQPEAGVRIAAVVASYGTGSGYVLAGRSLREVEQRESQTLTLAALAWVVAVAGSLILVVLGEAFLTNRA